jgi:hypothetical protein
VPSAPVTDKVIAPLSGSLPKQEQYCVIFCHRDLEQILVLQGKMLRRLNQETARTASTIWRVAMPEACSIKLPPDRQLIIFTC